jgi:hypothetical protein
MTVLGAVAFTAQLFGASLLVLATAGLHRCHASVDPPGGVACRSEGTVSSRQFTAATIAQLLYFTGFSVFPLGGALFMQ